MQKWRWNNSGYELRDDFRFPTDRFKGKLKRYVSKRTIRKMRKEREKE